MRYTAPLPSSMSVKDLKNLVKTGEGTFLEFKRTVPSEIKIAREMAAFSNTHGGTLLIGVDDDKSLVGVSSYHEQIYLLEQAASRVCRPEIEFEMEIVPYNYRDIVIIRIPEMKEKPVIVTEGESEYVYIRVDDKSIKASPEMTSILHHRTSGKVASFVYGPYEQRLFRYLNEYEQITVSEYSSLIHTNRKRASDILVNLVNAGILILTNRKDFDYFSLAREVSRR